MSYPTYEDKRKSEQEWLSEVPLHWEVFPLKRLLDIRNGADYKAVEVDEGYPVIGSGGVFGYASDFLYDGESVLLGRKGTIDKPLYVTGKFWTVDTMYWSIVRPNVCGRFAYYASTTIPFGLYSTSTALPSMTKAALNEHRVPVPPLDEQKAIASFLDVETSKIDALVSEQRRLIELLKEKRQAVISHAVTKGLNPNAPMKPSGIPWLGDVPEHWSIVRVRRVLAAIEQGWSPQCDSRPASEDEWGILKTGCVNRGVFCQMENKALPDDLEPIVEYEVKAGDVLMSRASGSPELVGATAFVDEVRPHLMLSDKTFRIHLAETMERKFFVALFNSQLMRSQIEQSISGAEGLANNLPQSKLRCFVLALPPVTEQHEIVQELQSQCEQFDSLEAEAERAVTLLQERRTALISAAVTGKIDVRGFTATESVL